jgi:hypothetical protein
VCVRRTSCFSSALGKSSCTCSVTSERISNGQVSFFV